MTDNAIYQDGDTGEVLAIGEAERAEVVDMLAHKLINMRKFAVRMADIERKLTALMQVGDTVAHGGYAVACEMGPRPSRQINRQEIEVHGESLAPLGLSRREEPSVKVIWPGVGAFTTAAAKAGLARAGLNASTFLLDGGEPRPQIKVYTPQEDD